MDGTYLTSSDIVNWIKEWHSSHPTYTEAEVAVFAEALNGKIGQMDFRASNGGVAIGYAGVIGESGWKSGVFNTVSEIVDASNGKYSFINMGADNIQNQPGFFESLQQAVGEKNAGDIMCGKWTADNTRLRTSFGDALSINDFVSDNYMLNNACGDVQLIITDKARMDSVLNVTELERLLTMEAVTHINGIPKADLQNMDSITRFNMLKERFVLGLSNAKVFVSTKGIEILLAELAVSTIGGSTLSKVA